MPQVTQALSQATVFEHIIVEPAINLQSTEPGAMVEGADADTECAPATYDRVCESPDSSCYIRV